MGVRIQWSRYCAWVYRIIAVLPRVGASFRHAYVLMVVLPCLHVCVIDGRPAVHPCTCVMVVSCVYDGCPTTPMYTCVMVVLHVYV